MKLPPETGSTEAFLGDSAEEIKYSNFININSLKQMFMFFPFRVYLCLDVENIC